jgi:hypothetical protein
VRLFALERLIYLKLSRFGKSGIGLPYYEQPNATLLLKEVSIVTMKPKPLFYEY